MWLSRQLFEQLLKERSEAQGCAMTLEKQNISLQATLDWMKLRVNQVEGERAQLLYNYTGVKVPVPEIQTERVTSVAEDILAATTHFNDVGDEEAARLGIGWNTAGEVQFSKKAE